MDIKEAMDFITGTQKFGQNLGLARMECMLAKLGNPEKELRAIHIAGTNGKGSCAAIISEVLMRHGFSVGLYTSPYIEQFNERIQIDRKNIPEADLAHYTALVRDAVTACVAEGLEHPTEFEIITTIMFLYFRDKAPDYCVIEVGLGGDLDSTNVITPVLSVITSISFDHMNVLGNTLTEIARAKAGIIKPGVPVVAYPQPFEAETVLVETARAMGSELSFADANQVSFLGFDEEAGLQSLRYQTGAWDFTASLRLLGVHQQVNSLLAITALQKLGQVQGIELSVPAIAEALASVRWMGRFEILNRQPLVIIDGAHNVDGIRQLKRSLEFYYPQRPYVLILGILADKDIHQMADLIAREATAVVCVTPHSDRASLAGDLYQYIKSFNDQASYEEDYRHALESALAKCPPDGYVIASGSLYMVGDMRGVMRRRFDVPYEQ